MEHFSCEKQCTVEGEKIKEEGRGLFYELIKSINQRLKKSSCLVANWLFVVWREFKNIWMVNKKVDGVYVQLKFGRKSWNAQKWNRIELKMIGAENFCETDFLLQILNKYWTVSFSKGKRTSFLKKVFLKFSGQSTSLCTTRILMIKIA